MIDYQALAEEATVRPRDMIYCGEFDLGKRAAFTFSRHRACDTLTESNFAVISEDMLSRFPDDCAVERVGHWAVGWTEHLTVNMLDESDKVTDAGKAILDWRQQLEEYPVADDDHFSETEQQACIYSITVNVDVDEDQASTLLWLYGYDGDKDLVPDLLDLEYIDKLAYVMGYTDERSPYL